VFAKRVRDAALNEEPRMTKRKLLIFLIILLAGFVACGLFLLAPSLPSILGDYRASRALDLYPGSERIFEAVGDRAYPNSDVKLRYYWSEDSITMIRAYYEKVGYEFVPGQDKDGEWLITGFDRHNRPVQTGESSGPVVHESFCLNAEDLVHLKPRLDCYTLALVDATQPRIYDLTIMVPSTFSFLTPPPALSAIPPYGTVIVFTYFRENIW
jgi:hypothetical protein